MSGSESRMPDFIAVGPPRTATTWLQHALEGHVTLPVGTKETGYFRENYALGPQWYLAHFPPRPASRVAGEICPTYFDSPLARDRIANDIPRCRIICTLRDPVERIYSHYRLLRREGLLRAISFEHALENHRQWDGPGNMFSFSRYTANVKAWREKFGAEMVLTVLHDDLKSDPRSYLDPICAFIGIEPIDLSKSAVGGGKINEMNEAPRSFRLARRARALRELLRRRRLYLLSEGCEPLWNFCFGRGESFPPIDPRTEASLREYFRPEVDALSDLLGRDLTRWTESRRSAA
jgi:hypothetical protein